MSAVGNGGTQTGVRAYDFRRPERLTSRVRQRLRSDQTHLAGGLSQQISKSLRKDVAVEFQDLTEGEAAAILGSESDLVFRLSASSEMDVVLFVVEATLAQAMVDRLLGGAAVGREVDRGPTEIEIALVGRVVRGIRKAVQEALPAYLPGEEEPAYVEAQVRGEMRALGGVASIFSMTVGEETRQARLFCSYGALARFLALDTTESSGPEEASGGMTVHHIGRVRLRVKALFSSEPVQIRDITSLQVGDVLYLDRKLGDEVEIRVGGELAFFGHPGAVEGAMGVQVSRTR